MHLVQLNVHPLKSGAIRPVRWVSVLPSGLEHDRSWMVVDRDARMVSAREVHELFGVVADTPATDPALDRALRLRAPGHPDLVLDHPDADRLPVRLFSLDLEAVPAGPEADAWLRAVLGHDVRLVWCDDPSRRSLEPGVSEPGDHAAFPDAFPVTLASQASLDRLNDWIAETAVERGEEVPAPLPMCRFRANLVVDGDVPFAEDDWTDIRIGEVRLRKGKPVGRCVVTTIDPDTLETAKEPIRTLARHRRSPDGDTLFAVHLVPVAFGRIHVGDEVIVS
ncbi:MOSC N-terminal beta barrel domain-containing protein [Nocardioides sp.]|uniref:MOSC domain-containing protein n=1 Tax=Nocardioides sp. TaxID=35761 RepID=UPI002610B9F7|nr:MOSC N-terminal beta barrel domain-containing protein [Nocardioides sp.]MCW2739529.1 hypothetical protein [Nocardioides sp.]